MSSSDVLKTLKDKEIEYVDLRFTDPRGKLQHLTMDSTVVDEGMLNEGVFFDGSSIVFKRAFTQFSFKHSTSSNIMYRFSPLIDDFWMFNLRSLISSIFTFLSPQL